MDPADQNRPDPDELLKKIQQDEAESTQGKLKIFFGMCAGVGKTYTMLEAAHKAKQEKVDVVVGIVETHKRAETEELVKGLEVVPLKDINYRGTIFKEMDLDAILARQPSLVLVDELAHSNIPGSRHNKRYQDVLELLNNGISVYTTLNVQHIESRTDTVLQITGTTIRETVPDTVFDRADDIELVDITPDNLLQRLSEGKVYTTEKSKQAVQNFFRKGNLTALREMALRIAAERIDKDVQDYKTEKRIDATWKSGQKLMVAIGPSPYSANLIRWTRRLAYSMEAPWIALYIENDLKISEEKKKIITDNFNLAKELGAEVIMIQSMEVIDAIIRVARENNVTQIVIGKSRRPYILHPSLRKDLVKELLKKSGDIDVYIVGGERKDLKNLFRNISFTSQSSLIKYSQAVISVFALNLICYALRTQISYQSVSLIFLLYLAVMPLFNFGPGPILLSAVLSAFSWDYFFIPPQFTLAIAKVEDLLMLIMYFIVATVTGTLSSKIRTQQTFLRQREKRIISLFNLSKELSAAVGLEDIAEIAVKRIEQTFAAKSAVIFYESANKLSARSCSASTLNNEDIEWNIAQWVFLNGQKAGKFTSTLMSASLSYFPLKSKSGPLGVVALKYGNEDAISFEHENLLENFISQITNAVEREYLNDFAKKSLIADESEKLYKTLFNSISHELKTPITTIMGAVSSFKDEKIFQNKSVWEKFIEEIDIASERLNRLVENLLDMARLESGNLKLKLDYHSIEDLIHSVLEKLHNELDGHIIKVDVQEDIEIFKFDYGLLEQALINIVHNSVQYTPPGSEIKIEVRAINYRCLILVSDNGKGFPRESLNKLFDKFYRIPGTKAGGTGLGLSIAKGFIEAHKGTIVASNGDNGGAVFTISIPINI
jgi:two-component system sensor histidine kinase KdpD